MENNNDLKGLSIDGFINQTKMFYPEIFDDNATIVLIRPIIRKYLTKAKHTCKEHHSIKHYIENYIKNNTGGDAHIYRGELIYAMHLEGFKIERNGMDGGNYYFNVKPSDLNLLHWCSQGVLKYIHESVPGNLELYLKFHKRYYKYKYRFNAFIHNMLAPYNKYAVPVIAKEISEDVESVRKWFNILKNDKEVIPADKMEQLESIFGLSVDLLINKEDAI